MSSKAANWIIAAGAVLMAIGLCFLPAALGERPDADLLELGACLFSLGALIIAAGLYVKARMVQMEIASGDPGRSLHPPTSGFAAAVICAELKLRWFNARSTSFIFVAVAWPNTTMFAPALMYRPPARQPRRAGTWRRTHAARNRTFPFPSLLSSLQCQSYWSYLVKLRYARPSVQARPLVL